MSRVAVLDAEPETVLEDYERLLEEVGYRESLHRDAETIIKLNLSWSLYFPACSTEPWQLEGVLKKMRDDGYENLVAVENQTVVTHPWKGAYDNKWLPILNDCDVDFEPLTDVEWVEYEPEGELLAMDDLFGGVLIPEMFFDANMVHLPTVKTHGHTTTTGAMKDAFGGLIPKYRHHAHKRIHEVLVDLLTIQKEIHDGLFAVMDGTVCGNGAGPRTMEPYIGNLLLASEDQVAIDAVAASIMGFDPMEIDYIRKAHDKGLGTGDIDQIEIVGKNESDVKKLDFDFSVGRSPVVKWDQRLRKKTSGIKWLHNALFRSPIFRSFIFASEFYHDYIWYPTVGKSRISDLKETAWGQLFETYGRGEKPDYEDIKDWNPY